VQRPTAHRLLATVSLLLLTISTFTIAIEVPQPVLAQSQVSTSSAATPLFDDFTQDTALNTSMWQINGPVGSFFAQAECLGCSLIPLAPAFSSAGMEIAQANHALVVGSIQSVESFAPPFNATAVVEGTVANGHTFVFAISNADVTSGLGILGNLNPTDCSNLENCGDPSTCGTPGNSSVGANLCFYGIDVKIPKGGGGWKNGPKLYLTPSVNVVYTLQISVNASGVAQYSVSQAGQVLGRSTLQVGMGPFYLLMDQGEGSPVAYHGSNIAYWKAVSVTSPATSQALSVYPTEPSFTSILLNYRGKSLSSPIHVAAAMGPNYPKGLTVTFRPAGAQQFTNTADIDPSPSGLSSVMVNATLDCIAGGCMQPGGTQLPLNYSLTITASSGTYSKNTTVQLRLLKAKWLIMLYCASDPLRGDPPSSLQPDMSGNVLELIDATEANRNPAVGILVLFFVAYDSVTFPNAPAQPSNTIVLYKVANGTIAKVGSTWPQTNIKDPATLNKFLVTSMDMIPAERNQLVLADHGAGMRGYALFDGSTMSVPQLVAALTGTPSKLDILSFDACLMSQVDALYQLRTYASYFTASERTIPGPGYDYTGFLASLLKNPGQSTASYLGVIVSSYGTKYASSSPPENATLAAINSTELAGVVSSLDALSGLLVQHYGAHSGAFNATMLLVLRKSVYVDAGYPYVDIRSFAQNIMASPQITDQSVKNAAAAVIQATRAAVVANTTVYLIKGVGTPIMYEGLTVLMWQRANIPRRPYQMFTGIEAQLSFSNAAHWLPLLRCVNRSLSLSTAAWTLVQMVHPGHQLYLNVYDSAGRHTGYNSALLNFSRTATELIPGSYYLDFGNGTVIIALPPDIQSFRTVVDGAAMEEASESYNLTYTVIQNGTVTSAKTVQRTINQDTLESANVTVQSGVLAVGATTVTTSAVTITSSSSTSSTSSTSATSSATSTASQAAPSGGGGIPELPFQALAVPLLTAALAVSYILARRRPSPAGGSGANRM